MNESEVRRLKWILVNLESEIFILNKEKRKLKRE